jgi:hypothetical protein
MKNGVGDFREASDWPFTTTPPLSLGGVVRYRLILFLPCVLLP